VGCAHRSTPLARSRSLAGRFRGIFRRCVRSVGGARGEGEAHPAIASEASYRAIELCLGTVAATEDGVFQEAVVFLGEVGGVVEAA